MQRFSSVQRDVTIYTSLRCSYCVAAKRLLGSRAIAYREIDVTGDDAQRAWLAGATGRKTVPQIFIDGSPIGGYQELAALDRSGALRDLTPNPLSASGEGARGGGGRRSG